MKVFKILILLIILSSCTKEVQKTNLVKSNVDSWSIQEQKLIDNEKETATNESGSINEKAEIENSWSINSKTPIYDYIDNSLKKESRWSANYNLDLNLKWNWELILKINKDYWLITCIDWRWLWCLSRADEELIRNLEKELKEKFLIVKTLTVKYGEDLTYKDWKYYKEESVLWLSEDGKYAEVDFFNNCFWLCRMCSLYDTYSWECLLNYWDDKKTWHYIELDEKKLRELKQTYKVSENIKKEDWFFVKKLKVNEDVEIYGKVITPPEDRIYWDNKWTNLNYVHITTGLEVTITSKQRNYHWLYWHKKMQWIFLYVYDYWEGEPLIDNYFISQNLLDTKLSELYNNVWMFYYNKKEYNNAIKYFQKSLTINKNYWQAYYNQASTYALLWQKTKAIESLKEAIKIDKAFVEKAKNDKDFDVIGNSSEFLKLLK